MKLELSVIFILILFSCSSKKEEKIEEINTQIESVINQSDNNKYDRPKRSFEDYNYDSSSKKNKSNDSTVDYLIKNSR